MRAKLNLVADWTGTSDMRVDLPSYSIVTVAPDQTWAIVNVFGLSVPPQTPPVGDPRWQTIDGVVVLVGLDVVQRDAWWAKLAHFWPDPSHAWQPAFP